MLIFFHYTTSQILAIHKFIDTRTDAFASAPLLNTTVPLTQFGRYYFIKLGTILFAAVTAPVPPAVWSNVLDVALYVV